MLNIKIGWGRDESEVKVIWVTYAQMHNYSPNDSEIIGNDL